MTSRIHLTAGLLAVALLGVACGSAETVPQPTSDAPATTTTDAEAPTGVAAVDVKDFTFLPADLRVAVGTTVTWTNQDRFGHTATAGTPNAETGAFDLVLGLTTDADTTGLTASSTFDEPGTFEYFCRYHPSMVGTVTVTG